MQQLSLQAWPWTTTMGTTHDNTRQDKFQLIEPSQQYVTLGRSHRTGLPEPYHRPTLGRPRVEYPKNVPLTHSAGVPGVRLDPGVHIIQVSCEAESAGIHCPPMECSRVHTWNSQPQGLRKYCTWAWRHALGDPVPREGGRRDHRESC